MKDQADTSSFLGKLQNFVNNHFPVLFVVGAIIGLIFLIILLVALVKLHNRNAEIDELYDEYGIDLEEEEPAKPAVKEKGFGRGRQKPAEDDFDDFEEDDFDDYEEDDFEEDDFEEEGYEEDSFDEDDYEEEDFEEEAGLSDEDLMDLDFNESEDDEMGYTGRGLADELPIDDLDELLGETPKKKRGHMEDDDTFKVDFVDLD